ncbi:hypothetical protein P2G88_14000 [Aliiglaciecola sp. CAU 1673]|uniref:hypothetical protein n=1 Tax=Aliiglaciecola sp. CAU 1673 TaxID=3032595 RepID=UPI0023DBCA38|nr:hypothetical protein [Aliiglaciecola sp. CAU 1673]MDF2179367.1 hypothetical protein [Aliiglaciecola sp. CAU 1673]
MNSLTQITAVALIGLSSAALATENSDNQYSRHTFYYSTKSVNLVEYHYLKASEDINARLDADIQHQVQENLSADADMQMIARTLSTAEDTSRRMAE